MEIILKNLKPHFCFGKFYFDNPVTVRPMHTATVRGIIGHCLKDYFPSIIHSAFKPGQGNKKTPRLIFRPIIFGPAVQDYIEFKIVCWGDDSAQILTNLAKIADKFAGFRYGEQSAKIASADFSEPEKFLWHKIKGKRSLKIQLKTPFKGRFAGNWINEKNFTPFALINSAILRLNELYSSSGFINNPINKDKVLMQAQEIITSAQTLKFVIHRRYSSSQDNNIQLCGIIGTLKWDNLSHDIIDILYLSSIFHLGRHTSEGCGAIDLH